MMVITRVMTRPGHNGLIMSHQCALTSDNGHDATPASPRCPHCHCIVSRPQISIKQSLYASLNFLLTIALVSMSGRDYTCSHLGQAWAWIGMWKCLFWVLRNVFGMASSSVSFSISNQSIQNVWKVCSEVEWLSIQLEQVLVSITYRHRFCWCDFDKWRQGEVCSSQSSSLFLQQHV